MFIFLSAFKKVYNGNNLGTEHGLKDGSSFFKPSSFQLVINPTLVPKAFDCGMFNSWRLHRLLPMKIWKCKSRTKLTSLNFLARNLQASWYMCLWRKRTLDTLNASYCRRKEERRREWEGRVWKGREGKDKGGKILHLFGTLVPLLFAPTEVWGSCDFVPLSGLYFLCNCGSLCLSVSQVS